MNLFEAKILFWIQENLRVSMLNPILKAVTALGNGGAFWIVIALLLLAFRKTRRAGICCALALVFDLIAVNLLIKPIVDRVRPYEILDALSPLIPPVGDASFPSGHSAVSFAGAWALKRSMGKKWGAPMLILAGLIALSRLYVGVHYPTDVICGAAIGVALGEAAVRCIDHSWDKYILRLKQKIR